MPGPSCRQEETCCNPESYDQYDDGDLGGINQAIKELTEERAVIVALILGARPELRIKPEPVPKQVDPGKVSNPIIIDDEKYAWESLYMEAIKPLNILEDS